MKRSLLAVLGFMIINTALAGTEHYIRRDGNHVQHLKVTRVADDINVSMDVDFEPNGPAEEGQKTCSADISGAGKSTGENELTLKKQIEGEAKHCTLKINTTSDSAKVEQSADCGYYVAGICHFDSDGKELTRVK